MWLDTSHSALEPQSEMEQGFPHWLLMQASPRAHSASALQPATHAPPTHRTPFWQSPSAEHRCWQPPSEHCSPQPQSEEVLQLETQNPLEHLDPAGHDDWIPGEHLRLFFLQEW